MVTMRTLCDGCTRRKVFLFATLVAMLVIFGTHLGHQNNSLRSDVNDCSVFYDKIPTRMKFEISERKNYYFGKGTYVQRLHWDYQNSPEMDVQNIWFYNPSIIKLDQGHLFSSTLIWTAAPECKHIDHNSPSDMYTCLRKHSSSVTDGSTVIGFFDPNGCKSTIFPLETFTGWSNGDGWGDMKMLFSIDKKQQLRIESPSKSNMSATALTDDFFFSASSVVLFTALSSEMILSDEWEWRKEGEEEAFLPISMMHIFQLTLATKSMSRVRAVYYDPHADKIELEKRRNSNGEWMDLFKEPIDFGRELCHQRPPHLPQFPFLTDEFLRDPNTRMWFKKVLYETTRKVPSQKLNESMVEFKNFDAWKSPQIRKTYKDKNWSPFVWNSEAIPRMLWSYMIEPQHIVCEPDIDLLTHQLGHGNSHTRNADISSSTTAVNSTSRGKTRWLGRTNIKHSSANKDESISKVSIDGSSRQVDCLLCVRKYSTWTSQLFNVHAKLLAAKFSLANPVYHLNGVPAHLVTWNGEIFFLGVLHSISDRIIVDSGGKAGEGAKVASAKGDSSPDSAAWRIANTNSRSTREYTHFFYRMQPYPPFHIIDVSSAPIPLRVSRGTGPWLEEDEILMVAFVCGFQIIYSDSETSSDISEITGTDRDEYKRQQQKRPLGGNKKAAHRPHGDSYSILLSYGSGDYEAVVKTISLTSAMKLFV